ARIALRMPRSWMRPMSQASTCMTSRYDRIMSKTALACLFLLAPPVAADSLSDLRAVLQRYPANAPFAATASVQVSGDSQGVAGARSGSTIFEVESGPSGLT